MILFITSEHLLVYNLLSFQKTGRVQEEISLLENINAREIEIARQSPLNLNGVENVAFSASPVAAVKVNIFVNITIDSSVFKLLKVIEDQIYFSFISAVRYY